HRQPGTEAACDSDRGWHADRADVVAACCASLSVLFHERWTASRGRGEGRAAGLTIGWCTPASIAFRRVRAHAHSHGGCSSPRPEEAKVASDGGPRSAAPGSLQGSGGGRVAVIADRSFTGR